MFGKGAYFAKDASYSDRYSDPRPMAAGGFSFGQPKPAVPPGFHPGPQHQQQAGPANPGEVNWMFMARIIVGRMCKGTCFNPLIAIVIS